MKTTRLPATIVAISWLATLILTVAWVAFPSRRPLVAQGTASPSAAAGTTPAQAIHPSTPTGADLASQADPNLQVLTQGAVHEAFGQPVLFNPAPNPIIPNQPPAPVEELPPSAKPVGNNVQWIPGYWSWEAAQQKFVWTSGIWRLIPPGLAWVPGYWTRSGAGYQWVSGFWRRSETEIASASFGKQLGVNGLGNPTAGNLADTANAAPAVVPNQTPDPTVPAAAAPVANPTNTAGTNPTVAVGGVDDRQAFFDSRIRPVLLGTCAKCHGSKKTSNNLRLDSRAALLKGGDSGPAIVAGEPDKSLLIQAVRYTGVPKMPPNKKLDATVIADFERWVRDGAIFPDGGTPVAAATAPGSAPVSADALVAAAGTPVAAAGESPNLGAVPGPDPTAANQTAGTVPAPTTIAASPTSADPAAAATTIPAIAADPAAPTVDSAAPIATPGAANTPPANPLPTNPASPSATGVPYVPRPPASLESGPLGNPPTADFTWIPGTWIYRHGRFLWLAGQWSPIRRGWVWVPARYVFTPAGYIFVDGFWDFELAQRGVLFAPVAFRHGYHGWGFSYTPRVVLNTNRLTEFLFVNSPCGCYCFGDYFGASHVQAGIFPWFAFHMSSLGYDPFFAFSSWAHHREVGWHERLITDFRAFRDDARLRPPRTFEDLVTRTRSSEERSERLALPFSRFVARTELSPLRFERVSTAERGEIDRSLHRFREAANRRFEFETRVSRNEPDRRTNRESRFADVRRDFRDDRRGGDDRRDPRLADHRREKERGEPVSRPEDVYLHHPRSEADDRREGKSDEGKGKFIENRRDSSSEKDGKRFADDRRESRIADDRNRTEHSTQHDRTTNRTPPVVPRTPVSTAGLRQRPIQEDPAQRLANPKFVPQASNRGRSESTEKPSKSRRH